jgi:hypothetical protein
VSSEPRSPGSYNFPSLLPPTAWLTAGMSENTKTDRQKA